MEKLIVSTSPHLHTKDTTQTIMRDVLIALTPAWIASVVLFGLKALLNIVLCVGVCILSEFLFNLITKKKQTIVDLSVCVTGLLLALSLPTTANIWHCIVGSVFAIVVVKCLFGGIGCNFANPAATARVLLLIAFSSSIAGGTVTNSENAIAYSEGKNIYITLLENNDEMCRIRFEDDGKGVQDKQLPRLFERFYRVDKGRSRQKGGTGLGLAIVKHAVQFHEGSITVTNRPNGGLRFDFSLKKRYKR